jgi:hypothetical protein
VLVVGRRAIARVIQHSIIAWFPRATAWTLPPREIAQTSLVELRVALPDKIDSPRGTPLNPVGANSQLVPVRGRRVRMVPFGLSDGASGEGQGCGDVDTMGP